MSPDEEVDLGHTIAKSEELNLPVRIFPSYYKVFSPILGGGVFVFQYLSGIGQVLIMRRNAYMTPHQWVKNPISLSHS